MGQKTVTLRFTTVLDEAGLQDIHRRIRREARLDRQIHDVLSRAEVTEKTIHVNLKESKVTDPDELRDLLLRGGMTLVSSGEAAGVLDVLDKLSTAAKRQPRLLLVRAFAEYSLGRYQLASGHLADVSLRAKELSESDCQFLGLLRDVCDYHLGRITANDYLRRQKELSETAEGEFGLSRRIDYLWSALLADGGRRGIATYLPQLLEAVAQALATEDTSQSFRIQARTARLHGEGVRFIQRFNNDLKILGARRAMGRHVDVEAVFEGLNMEQARWTDEANDLVKDAFEDGNPRLIGDACYVRSFILFVHYSTALQRLTNEAAAKHVEILKSQVIPDLRRAIECYRMAGHIEWELRAKLLLADLSDLTGDRTAAVNAADEVLPVAEAYQYDKIAKEARDHLAGDPFFRQMQRKFLTRPDDDPDVREARFTDEDMGRYAEDVLEASGLPRDRLAVMTREVFSFRDVARERVHWCRHIQLIQDLGHTRSPVTFYAYDPERRCYCEKYGFASKVGSTDWRVLIETFKNNYCSGCPARSPKGDSLSTP